MGQLCIWTKATLGCSGPPSCQTSKKMVREADQGKLRHKHPYSLIKKPLCLHSVSAHQLLCPLSPRGVHTPAHHLGTFQGERTVDPRRKKVQLPPWNSVLPDRTVLWVPGWDCCRAFEKLHRASQPQGRAVSLSDVLWPRSERSRTSQASFPRNTPGKNK